MPNEETHGDNLTFEFDEIEQILSELANKKRSVSEATGALRNAIKQWLENSGAHPKALATIRQINDMSDSYRADFMRSFKPMFELMDENVWIPAQSDMFEANGDGSGDEASGD
jgi:hypothetical protein